MNLNNLLENLSFTENGVIEISNKDVLTQVAGGTTLVVDIIPGPVDYSGYGCTNGGCAKGSTGNSCTNNGCKAF